MKINIFLILLFISTGCSYAKLDQRAEIGIIRNELHRNSDSRLRIHVPSTTGFVVAGVDPSPILFLSPDRSLSELAAVELRKKLLSASKFRVFGDAENVEYDYQIKVACSEFTDDITNSSSYRKVPTIEAGVLIASIASSSANYLPAVGALIQTFEPLTGITLSEKNKERTGAARFDFHIYDKNGIIIKTYSIPVSFVIRVVERGGGISMSEYKVVVASTPQDAVRVAVDDAVNKITSLLN